MIKILVRRETETARLPVRANPYAAGDDVFADDVSYARLKDGIIEYDTGLSFEILDPEFYLQIAPRSSIYKTDLTLANSIGVIDNDYRGTLKFMFRVSFRDYPQIGDNIWYDNKFARGYRLGDRIGQILVCKYHAHEYEEVDLLSETERGTGGFGSTGK